MKATSPNPYFIIPALRQLKQQSENLTDEQLADLKQRIALNTADPAAAVQFADLAGDDWAHIYPAQPEPEKITTDNAINTFLNTYGSRNPKEDALLERLIFNPTPDYSQLLEQQDSAEPQASAPATEQDALIDAFISHSTGDNPTVGNLEDDILAAIEQKEPDAEPQSDTPAMPETIAPDAPPAAKPESSLSESLAKIYIKQGRYERAFEIISDLNLNYPEKSVYFADQLRFLQKLISLQQSRNHVAQSK